LIVSAERWRVSSLGSGNPVRGAVHLGFWVVVVVGAALVEVVVEESGDDVVVVVESANAAGVPTVPSARADTASARLKRLMNEQ